MQQKVPETVIFDFDGTIADTMRLVFSIYNRLAPEYGCTEVSIDEGKFLRTKRPQEFFRSHGMTMMKLPRFSLRVKKEIGAAITQIALFDGIREALEAISARGYQCGIVTSNSVDNVTTFLEYNGLSRYFNFVWSGNNIFGKHRAIKAVLNKRKLPRNRVVYIGDETRDIDAVRKVHIPIVAVSWGYSTREILSQLQPDAIADSPADLVGCIAQVLPR